MFTRIAAQVDGTPCCTYIGDGGAGHYVKMVHNGIEYADMQLIAESYDLLHNGLGLDDDALHDVFSEWNAGELDSFLIQITAEVFARKDDDGDGYLIDMVLDEAEQKGTGRLTAQSALELGAPLTAITEAVFARSLSALKDDRVAASKVLPGPGDTGASHLTKDDVRDALFASKIVAYAQGFDQLQRASDEFGWNLDLGALATIWRGGCIIRARFLDRIKEVYDERAAEEPHARAVLHRAAGDRAIRLAAHSRGGDPHRHPDARVLVVTGVVRRLPPRAPARQPDPGATRPVRRAHLRTRRPRGHFSLRLVGARLTRRSCFRDVGLRKRVEHASQRFGVAFRAQVAGLHRFLDAPRAEREVTDRLQASFRGDVGARDLTARDLEATVPNVDVELVVADAQVRDDAHIGRRVRVECRLQRKHERVDAERAVGGERTEPAPTPERDEHRLQRGAGFGQLVDHGRDRRAQPALAHDAHPFQFAEPLRQHVLAHAAEPAVEVREPFRAVEELADDEERPPLADGVEGPGDPAPVAVRAPDRRLSTLGFGHTRPS